MTVSERTSSERTAGTLARPEGTDGNAAGKDLAAAAPSARAESVGPEVTPLAVTAPPTVTKVQTATARPVERTIFPLSPEQLIRDPDNIEWTTDWTVGAPLLTTAAPASGPEATADKGALTTDDVTHDLVTHDPLWADDALWATEKEALRAALTVDQDSPVPMIYQPEVPLLALDMPALPSGFMDGGIASVTVAVSGIRDGAAERLIYDLSDTDITGHHHVEANRHQLTLQLTGQASGQSYAKVLGGLSYENNSPTPAGGERVITVDAVGTAGDLYALGAISLMVDAPVDPFDSILAARMSESYAPALTVDDLKHSAEARTSESNTPWDFDAGDSVPIRAETPTLPTIPMPRDAWDSNIDPAPTATPPNPLHMVHLAEPVTIDRPPIDGLFTIDAPLIVRHQPDAPMVAGDIRVYGDDRWSEDWSPATGAATGVATDATNEKSNPDGYAVFIPHTLDDLMGNTPLAESDLADGSLADGSLANKGPAALDTAEAPLVEMANNGQADPPLSGDASDVPESSVFSYAGDRFMVFEKPDPLAAEPTSAPITDNTTYHASNPPPDAPDRVMLNTPDGDVGEAQPARSVLQLQRASTLHAADLFESDIEDDQPTRRSDDDKTGTNTAPGYASWLVGTPPSEDDLTQGTPPNDGSGLTG